MLSLEDLQHLHWTIQAADLVSCHCRLCHDRGTMQACIVVRERASTVSIQDKKSMAMAIKFECACTVLLTLPTAEGARHCQPQTQPCQPLSSYNLATQSPAVAMSQNWSNWWSNRWTDQEWDEWLRERREMDSAAAREAAATAAPKSAAAAAPKSAAAAAPATAEAEDAELDALLGGSLEGPATKKDFANLRRLCHRRLQRQNKAHAEAQRQMRERHLQEVEELKVAHMRQLMSNGIALQGLNIGMQAQKSVDEMYETKIAELDTAADKHKAEKKKLEMALAAEKVLNEEQKTAHSKEIEELRATHAKELEDKDAFIQKQGHALQLWKAHETKHKERLQRKDATIAQLRLDLGPERAQARLEKQLFEDCSWRKEKTSCATLRGTRNLAGSGPPGRSPCKTQGPWLSGPFIPKWTQHNMTWGRPLPRSRLHLPHRPASARRPFPRFRFWTFVLQTPSLL